jgi:ATP-dependent RNA helicase HrpB
MSAAAARGLPIEAALPELLTALQTHNQAVLQAPPGAGKTTRVPLFLHDSRLFSGRILMLEPRRLATRAAAERMAQTLGEPVGARVGYTMRGDRKTSKNTRIEVVTEGVLTRMIQSDPELSGISCVIFDEFHERSLQADLGLALCLEIREALRQDLCLIVMSATLDAEPVAQLMGDAPVITSQGRSYPVQVRHLPMPWARPDRHRHRFEAAIAGLVRQAMAETRGSLLVFLPGEGEIRRVQALLAKDLPDDTVLRPLYGAMPFKAQRQAISPVAKGRKLVLATAIAETSLTIEDIRVVVDGGRARRARFDAGSGMSRLVTERVTRAEATQRQGRAGRVASGICYKLWTRGEEGGLAPFAPPEILAADLCDLVLELAQWGASDPTGLPFLTPPREADFLAAQAVLQNLSVLGRNGTVTPHGRAVAKLPLHPRLGHMLLRAGKGAGLVAAMLAARDVLAPVPTTPPADLALRLEALRDADKFTQDRPFTINQSRAAQVRQDARRLHPGGAKTLSLGAMAALAYPDRIGLRRKGDEPRYLLSGGKGACFAPGDAMGRQRLIVATDLDGDQREARIRLATPVSEAELRHLFADRISAVEICEWSRRDRVVTTRLQVRLGALALEDRNWQDCPAERQVAAMLEGIRDLGLEVLPWDKAARLMLARIEWLSARGAALPDCSDSGLLARLEHWLAPHLSGVRRLDDLGRLNMAQAVQGLLSWQETQRLDTLAPASITAPTGTRLAIDYSTDPPSVSVRLQELFGLTTHPTVGPDRLPLLIELLSPARRPVQTTADLPGFWASSYLDVRKDMRGRYPRHPWPEDPTRAEATRRAKPRKDRT